MKHCFVYEYYHPHLGGGESLLKQLAEGLVERGHQCTVVTARLAETPARELINGVEVRRVRVPRRGDRYWFTLMGLPAVLAAAGGADIIHAPTYNGAIAAWTAARMLRKPVVLHPFEVLGRLWLKLGIRPVPAAGFMAFERLVLSLPFDAYGCISRHTMRSLAAAAPAAGKAFLAYPGIDYSLFDPGAQDGRKEIRRQLGIDGDTFLCMYSGRPGFIKGLEFLVDAIPEIRQKVPTARFLLLLANQPETKYREALAALARFREDEVIVRPPVSRAELPLYFQASDCVIVPSLNEGFGFTCVEACTMGRPVVATRAGSLPEVISGRYVLVEPGSAAAIATGVERVHRGDCQVSGIKRFEWQDAIDRHIQACEDLLASPGCAQRSQGRPYDFK